jgi:hypothetical protein
MTYENPAIQKSINETLIAQQLKVVSEAKFEARLSCVRKQTAPCDGS